MRIPAEVAAILAKVARERAAACAACGLRAPVEGDLCASCGAAARELAAERAEEKKFWTGQPKPGRTPEPELVEPEPMAERTVPAVAEPSRGEPRIPQQDAADVAVAVEIHETIRRYGKALVAGDKVEAVKAMWDLQDAIAKIPPAKWTRFARLELAPYAAIAVAERMRNDPGAGRHISKHILSARILQTPLDQGDGGRNDPLDTAATWRLLLDAATRVLFDYHEDGGIGTSGRIIQNVLGPGGLKKWQKQKLLQFADPSRWTKGGRSRDTFTTTPEGKSVIMVVAAALELFARRWASHSPAELLDLVLGGKLDFVGRDVEKEIVRQLERAEKQDRLTRHLDGETKADKRAAKRLLVKPDVAGLDDWLGLEEIEALANREDLAPAFRQYIADTIKMLAAWEPARPPTIEEHARELDMSTRQVKRLRADARALVGLGKASQSSQPAARNPPPAMRPLIPGSRQDIRLRFDGIVGWGPRQP